MPASLLRLVLHEGVLVSRQTNDDQMAARDAEDAALAPSRPKWTGGGRRSPPTIRAASA